MPSASRASKLARRWVTPLLVLSFLASPVAAEPALWHISDGDSDIYLLGTVHILPSGMDWQTPEIEMAFESADTVWFEAPVNDPASAIPMALLIQEVGVNPPSRPLSTQVSPQAWAALSEFAPGIGLPVARLEPLRPWLAAVTLAAAYVQSRGYNPQSGVEAQLWPLANQRGKKLEYFETLEQQLRFFADLPMDVEVGFFEQTVMEFKDASALLEALVSAWESGDLELIDQLVNGEMRRVSPDVYDVVIAQRNRNWVGQIQTLLAGSGSHFVALGAGHMAGAEGVIERLRAAGVQVSGP